MLCENWMTWKMIFGGGSYLVNLLGLLFVVATGRFVRIPAVILWLQRFCSMSSLPSVRIFSSYVRLRIPRQAVMSDRNEISSAPKNCCFYSIPNMFIIGAKDDVRLSHYKYGPSVDLANSRLVIGWDIIKFSDDEDLQNKRLFYSLSFESVFLCCL